jgi:hypothetical protein
MSQLVKRKKTRILEVKKMPEFRRKSSRPIGRPDPSGFLERKLNPPPMGIRRPTDPGNQAFSLRNAGRWDKKPDAGVLMGNRLEQESLRQLLGRRNGGLKPNLSGDRTKGVSEVTGKTPLSKQPYATVYVDKAPRSVEGASGKSGIPSESLRGIWERVSKPRRPEEIRPSVPPKNGSLKENLNTEDAESLSRIAEKLSPKSPYSERLTAYLGEDTARKAGNVGLAEIDIVKLVQYGHEPKGISRAIDNLKSDGHLSNEQVRISIKTDIRMMDHLKNEYCGHSLSKARESLRKHKLDTKDAITTEHWRQSLRAWRAKYPDEAAYEDSTSLLGRMEKTYDASKIHVDKLETRFKSELEKDSAKISDSGSEKAPTKRSWKIETISSEKVDKPSFSIIDESKLAKPKEPGKVEGKTALESGPGTKTTTPEKGEQKSLNQKAQSDVQRAIARDQAKKMEQQRAREKLNEMKKRQGYPSVF